MHPQSSSLSSRPTNRFAVALALGTVTLAASLGSPAFAQEHDRYRFEGRGSWQEHGRRHEHWRPEHRSDGYYSAPPMVVFPPGYYVQPGASLNFSFPLFIR